MLNAEPGRAICIAEFVLALSINVAVVLGCEVENGERFDATSRNPTPFEYIGDGRSEIGLSSQNRRSFQLLSLSHAVSSAVRSFSIKVFFLSDLLPNLFDLLGGEPGQ